jgi:HTH-type transcriptional regulator, sugar sensing transcriptional regulator
MYENELQELGLTEGEAKVYLALTTLGDSTVGPIVKKSSVSYSNIYEILDRLLDKGLVSFIIKEKTKHFHAVEPTRLTEYLDKQQETLNHRKQVLQKVAPSLEGLRKQTTTPHDAEIFLGEKGLLTAYELMVKDVAPKTTGRYFWVHEPTYDEAAVALYNKSYEIYKAAHVSWRGISDEAGRQSALTTNAPTFIQVRHTTFPLPGAIDIIGDKILIVSWKLNKPVGVLIRSQEVANNFNKYFDAMWEMAKK